MTALATPVCSEADEPSDRLHQYFSTREPALRNQIVREHADLAYRLARKFIGRGEPFEDLLQVAFVGLIQAVDRFDPDAGVPLTSFAVPTILGELRRYFRDRAWSMRVPRRLQEIYLEAKTTIDVLTQDLGRSPTYGEIAGRLAVTEEDLVEALEAGRNFYALSLDAPVTNANGTTVMAPSQLDPALQSVENRGLIDVLADGLPPRTRLAVELRFARDMTQSEIARRLGVSQMQVSRMLTKALQHMRQRASRVSPRTSPETSLRRTGPLSNEDAHRVSGEVGFDSPLAAVGAQRGGYGLSMAKKTSSNEESDISGELDPSGEHGREAVEDVARKMHIDRQSQPSADDPTGEHDPAALQEVARKMGLKR